MDDDKRPIIWAAALVLMPALLAVAIVTAIVLKVRAERTAVPDGRLAMAASAVNAAELRDLLTKLEDLVGERDWTTPEGRQAIRRAIALIDGTLSPQNYGFQTRRGGTRSFADELWPIVWADLEGSGRGAETVVVAVPYDRGDEAVAAVLALANDLRDDELARTVRLAFFPARLAGADDGMAFLAGGEPVRLVLVVDALASSDDALWATDGTTGGPHPAVGPDGGITTLEGSAAPIDEERAAFAGLDAPVYVCRGLPLESGESPPAGEEAFDRFLTRTVKLRNLVRDLGQAGAKRP